jgi:alkanesulfonate monooxygenase SsuD/methylene tetrahydromethanopterin reductase-like flavin-dependent oxidoreductase (luciferase family)
MPREQTALEWESPMPREQTALVDLYAGHGLRLDEAVPLATATESAGFGGLWTLEAHTEPFLPLVLAAEHTSRIELGTAVVVALARNPMIVAHLAHELNRYAGGRFSLGLGPQVGAHITRRFGAPFDHPAERMTEFVLALRAIWRCWNQGEPLDFRGRYYRHDLMTPAFDPGPSGVGLSGAGPSEAGPSEAGLSEAGPSSNSEPRVLLAAVGPRMTAAACAVADGLIAHPLTSRRVAQEQLRPRIAAAVRPGFELSCPVLVITGRTDQELDQARAAVRRQIAFYASTPAYRSVLELYGAGELSDRLREMSRAGQWDAMTALIPDDLLREFSVEAPAGALAAALHARFDGVLDRILVYAPYPVAADRWGQLMPRT